MLTRMSLTAAAVLSIGMAVTAQAAEPGLQLGVLECNMTDRDNFIVYTDTTFDCTFTNGRGDTANFEGQIDKIGIDASYDFTQQFNWLVLAPSLSTKPQSIAGTYGALSTNVAVVGGAGVRTLVGGSGEQITLQPFTSTGHGGIGAAFGVEAFRLSAK